MTTKEKLKELLKDEFEECTEEEATSYRDGDFIQIYTKFLSYRISDEETIYFKPKQKFPIVFEGENLDFIISSTLALRISFKHKKYICSEKDIEANKKALDKWEELRK